MRYLTVAFFTFTLGPFSLIAIAQAIDGPSDGLTRAVNNAYILGPEDSLNIRVQNAEELGTDPYPIDLNGDVNLPLAGRVHAAGLTSEELETLLVARFK